MKVLILWSLRDNIALFFVKERTYMHFAALCSKFIV